MAAASYTTDLALIHACDAASASWTEPTAFNGGAITLPETDFFIHNTGCLSKNCGTTTPVGVGAIYNFGSGVTIPTSGAFLTWLFFGAPNTLATQSAGGLQILVGSGANVYKQYYVRGSDTYPYGGWVCVPVDPTTTQNATTGSPTTTVQYFGAGASIPGASIASKGNPFGIDILRYGRCESRMNGGDLANGYATFAGFSAVNDTLTNRWGLIQVIQGGYLVQGLVVLGYTSAVDFRDSSKIINFADTQKVSAAFNAIEIRQATSRVDMTDIIFTALGTTSKGNWITTDNATVNIITSTFNGMGTFSFQTNTTILSTNFKGCSQITLGGAKLTKSAITGYEGTSNTSSLIFNTATDPDTLLDSTSFTKGTAATHAIEFGTSSPTTMTLRNMTFSGYNASNTQNDSTLHIKRTTGTVTINLILCTGNISYRSDGATVVLVTNPVTLKVTVKDIDTNSIIVGARVLLKVTSGVNWPFEESVTITSASTTATVSHPTHRLSTNDYVIISGADQDAYNGVHQITVTTASGYTFTLVETATSPATGTIIATTALISDVTNGSGEVSVSKTYSNNQPFSGWVRMSTNPPYYKQQPITDTVSSTLGLSVNVLLILDQ